MRPVPVGVLDRKRAFGVVDEVIRDAAGVVAAIDQNAVADVLDSIVVILKLVARCRDGDAAADVAAEMHRSRKTGDFAAEILKPLTVTPVVPPPMLIALSWPPETWLD